MKKIFFAAFVLMFLLLRPYQLQDRGLWYVDDDYDYFAHSSAIAFGQFPSYAKEFFVDEGRPLGSIGSGLMAAPFVFLFSLIDRAQGATIIHTRSFETIVQSWSLFGFVFASNVYFLLAVFLLYKGLRYYVPDRYASLACLVTIFCQGIPLFAFRRPVFSHASEFFLQSLMVFFLLRMTRKNAARDISYPLAGGIGIAAGLIVLTRYNNVAAAALWPVILFFRGRDDLKNSIFWKKCVTAFICMAACIVLFKWYPDVYTPNRGYGGMFQDLLTFPSLSFYAKRVFHILWGFDWGLFYTAPFIVIGLLSIACVENPTLRVKLWLCSMTMAANMYAIVMWRTQGGWYGYRYIIASIIPLIIYPVANLLMRLDVKYKRYTVIVFVVALIAVLPTLSMVCFEGSRGYLGLRPIDQYFGANGWGNNSYQLQVWDMVLFHPVDFFTVFFCGGPYYFVNLILLLLQKPLLTAVAYSAEVWSVSSLTVIRLCLLYALPFVLYGICYRYVEPSDKSQVSKKVTSYEK